MLGFFGPTINMGEFLLCMAIALALGFALAISYMFKAKYTKSFVVTLALLPTIVCVVIMMVNGNLGAGVAVAGTFSLVRFRSVPGTAREILSIFLAMGAGLIVGMGFLGYAAVFTLVMCAMLIFLNLANIGSGKKQNLNKTLKITIPEDLDYTEAFSDILAKYTTASELVKVKTSNMGSMFKLTYDITLASPEIEKEFIDALRTRNGNLEIMLSRQENLVTEL